MWGRGRATGDTAQEMPALCEGHLRELPQVRARDRGPRLPRVRRIRSGSEECPAPIRDAPRAARRQRACSCGWEPCGIAGRLDLALAGRRGAGGWRDRHFCVAACMPPRLPRLRGQGRGAAEEGTSSRIRVSGLSARVGRVGACRPDPYCQLASRPCRRW